MYLFSVASTRNPLLVDAASSSYHMNTRVRDVMRVRHMGQSTSRSPHRPHTRCPQFIAVSRFAIMHTPQVVASVASALSASTSAANTAKPLRRKIKQRARRNRDEIAQQQNSHPRAEFSPQPCPSSTAAPGASRARTREDCFRRRRDATV